ncbi:MAG TPA: hypothetical protein VI911_10575 [Patescibacteria group bacterium]|nr:hypothetical protein [Patescibacteria group bacterium]
MQTGEIYNFALHHYEGGEDLLGKEARIKNVRTCTMICSHKENCDNQRIVYSVGGLCYEYDECCVLFKRTTRPAMMNPDNLFEVF